MLLLSWGQMTSSHYPLALNLPTSHLNQTRHDRLYGHDDYDNLPFRKTSLFETLGLGLQTSGPDATELSDFSIGPGDSDFGPLGTRAPAICNFDSPCGYWHHQTDETDHCSCEECW
ncbi:unnamed protein product [Protopolystoma xenopodis]|uniref:Uncharacterized protein n=1 Tax=Protopolystoma xenopodis TaxID=117903 RepID=A0A3S5CHA1_9PLAT|nr:unnamed protein product [Protopolystoma xenopodis]